MPNQIENSFSPMQCILSSSDVAKQHNEKEIFPEDRGKIQGEQQMQEFIQGSRTFLFQKIPTSSIPGSCNIYLEVFHNFYIPVMAMCLSSLLFFKESVCCHNHVLVSPLYVGEGEKTFHFIHLSLNQEKPYLKLTQKLY